MSTVSMLPRGTFRPVSTIATDNPSYLAVAPGGKFVYAVNETHEGGSGNVSAFSFDKKTGRLSFLDKQATGGDDPCYVSVDKRPEMGDGCQLQRWQLFRAPSPARRLTGAGYPSRPTLWQRPQ